MAQFDDAALDDEFPKKSKTPLILLGVAVVALLAVGAVLMGGGGPSLSPEELAVFEEAQTALRSDDYNAYPAGEKKLLATLEKYPDYVPAMSWLMQMYCAWGESLKFESQAFQLAAALTSLLISPQGVLQRVSIKILHLD